jgi:hypothetical protein
MKKLTGALVFLCLALSCSPEKPVGEPRPEMKAAENAATGPAKEQAAGNTALAAISETERSHRWAAGLSLREAGIREGLGDYAGAVLAAFKELFWDYSRNGGQYDRETGLIPMRNALRAIRDLYTGQGQNKLNDAEKGAALGALDCIESFMNGNWTEARDGLQKLAADETEPDSFAHWMELVCLMEEGGGNDAVLSTYSAIRARYESFPPYWYFGARNMPAWINGEYAERCINSAASGPYAPDARKILASFSGLQNKDGTALLSKFEIEALVVKAINENNPQILSSLFPLLALNDNPYTLYASGALRSLAIKENFKDWFAAQEKIAVKTSAADRLADRLRHIAKG